MSHKAHIQLLSTTLTDRELQFANRALRNNLNCDEPYLNELSEQLKSRFNSNYCFPFMGGRSSLMAIIKALNLDSNDEVLVPAFTCQAVVNAINAKHSHIKYVDVEADTYGMDADCLEKIITDKSRVLFIQYSFGLICRDIDKLLSIAHKHKLIIIEDCAHALGATYNGIEVGNFGDIAFFSSERSKLINTIHGGFIICHHTLYGEALKTIHKQSIFPPESFIEKLLLTIIDNYYRYGKPKYRHLVSTLSISELLPQMFQIELEGKPSSHYQYKMPNTIAGLMLLQLEKLDERANKREKNAQHWKEVATNNGWIPPIVIENSTPAWLRYPVQATEELKQQLIKNPEFLKGELDAAIGVWFTSAAHPTPIELPHCPVGSQLAKTCINLPTY